MLVQKLAVIGVVIAAIIVVVLASLITNSIRNTRSSLSASPATTAVAETLVNSSNSYNSTNNTSQLLHHGNLTLSPSTRHPPLPAPQNKSLSEQPQENRLRGPPLPSSSEPIRGPAPGTASP